MNPDDFKDPETGRLVPTLKGMAFVPNPLPPPRIDLAALVPLVSRAERALGELSGIGRTLPNPYLLIRPFMRREAVASSKIEGTVTTLSQLLLFEVDEETNRAPGDAREVLNYVRALEHSLKRLDKLPVSARLICEAHKILLTNVPSERGARIIPGEFRKDQNWIGAKLVENARYVPPPPLDVPEAMSALEKYINGRDEDVPTLIQLALIHYQFEAIHPFPDGNGRVGRLLIPLILCARKEISQPLLYMSSYFEKNYQGYIDRMLAISKMGHWTQWVSFFLEGIEESCKDAITRAQSLQMLQKSYYGKIQRARSSALLGQLIELLFEHPAITVPYAADRLQISYNAAKNNIGRLVEAKILRPSGGNNRPMVFVATDIVKLIG